MTSDPNVSLEGMELFFTYCSPNVVMMTIPVFLIARYAKVGSEKLRLALANLTKCGFGKYCVLYFFIGPCYVCTLWLGVPIPVVVPVSALFTFACSWTFVYFVSKLPGAKYVIG